jgi:hypothetical protein
LGDLDFGGEQMTLRILLLTVALGVVTATAQMADGEIAGRLKDKQEPLPGVRVRITNGDQSSETVADGDGRFVFGSLAIGTYRVVAELAGFKSASGEIALSSSTPRVFLAWALEPGCLEEIQRVALGARSAARRVETIVHVRVAAAAGPVRISVHPDCEGRVFQEYSVQVLGSALGQWGTSGTEAGVHGADAVRLASGQST